MVRDYDESEIPAVHNLEEVPPVRDEPGFRQVVYRGLDQMVALSVVQPDKKDTDTHSHPWEQTNVLVEGELGFVVGDEQVTLEQYDALTVPPGVEHTSRAISDEEAKMLVIWPLREDRVAGTEYQTEFPTE
jgi:mannose-6-phosphate isomerase-like protein (cupin superfamily)